MDDPACGSKEPEESTKPSNNENSGLGDRQEIKKRKSCISPYNVFFSDYLQQQKKVCKDNFGQMSKDASVAWNNLEETEKQKFVKASQEKTTALVQKELPKVKSNREYESLDLQCCKCGKKIHRHITLKKHEAECGKTFSCSVCSKDFSTASHLRRHKKFVHDGKKSFKCIECDADFCTETDLRRHAISHTTLAQFACQICNSAFRYKNNLLRHIKKVHP